MNPNDIEAREFTVANRGYDREEVNAFLRVVGAEVRRLQNALARQGTSGWEAGGAPADELGSGPEAAEGASAPDPAETYRKVGDETARILVAAEQAAMEIKERGQREAAELVAVAREEAIALHKAAKAERGGLERDIRQLREARSLLGVEMEDMRRRFEELVLRLRQPFDVRRPKPKAGLPPTEPFFRSSPPPMIPVPAAPAEAPAAEEGQQAPPATPQTEAPLAEEPVVKLGASASIDVKASEAPAPFTSVNGSGSRAPEPEAAPPPERAPQPPEPEAAQPPEPEAAAELPPPPGDAQEALDWRDAVLGEMPADAARRLKRLLQEDQGDLLERLRTWRGSGPAASQVVAPDQHVARFAAGLGDVLTAAFQAGRGAGRVAGGSPDLADGGDPAPVVEALVTKQLVAPLRRDLLRLIESPSGGDATATAVSKRASDVYRVWKGVRTDLLGEGLVYAVFHQGLLDTVQGNGSAVSKEWVVSSDEGNCPREVCRSNASAGPVDPDAPFPSGHLAPPAHGGCTCTLLLVRA
jgi:DivIVA domain-containing protein